MRLIERDCAGTNRRFRTRAALTLLMCASFSGAVLAQDAGSLLREQERRRELEKLERARPASPEVASQGSVVRPELGETFLVKELRFAGKTEGLTESEKAAFAAQVQNRPVGVAGLQNLADNVTRALQGTGRLLARAILPPQDVTDGIVAIEIVEGTLEKIE